VNLWQWPPPRKFSKLNFSYFFFGFVLLILSNGVSWTRICIVSWLFWNKGLLYSQNGFFLSQGIGLCCLWMCLEHYLNPPSNSKNNTCNIPEPLYLYGLREINQTNNEVCYNHAILKSWRTPVYLNITSNIDKIWTP
jgi:hypothetical protein